MPVKPLRSLSLRAKLVLLAALLVAGPGVVLTLIAERSARRSLVAVIERQLAREAGHTADRLTALLRAEREGVRSFARQDLMRDIRVADVDKRVALALATLRDGSPLHLDYLVVSAGGDVVAASQPTLLGRAPRWLEQAWTRPGADARLAGPLRIPGYQTASLVMTSDIPDPDDPRRLLGTLVSLLDWERLTAFTQGVRSDLAAQGIAADVILNEVNGTVIGGAHGESPVADWIAGRAQLAPDLPQWTVVVREPRSHALAPVQQLSRRLALTMGMALVAALLLATVAARQVVRPLGELTAGIREIARGEHGRALVPVRGEDEIAALASSFNDMASRLDRTRRDLVEAEKFAFVGELAAGVAHEIRTSLGVLGSSAQILERSLPAGASAESAELAQMIRAEVARLGGVVDDLLTLHHGRPLRLEALPVSEVLVRAVDFVAPQAREKGVRLELRRPIEEPLVCGDRELLQQVAVNLLVNALHAVSADGLIEARVMPARNEEGGFDIVDDGPGIPPELRERAFQPFVSARPGGVGLGLTFVKRVVHEHRGSVTVDPGVGAGTCIRVRLPAAEGTP